MRRDGDLLIEHLGAASGRVVLCAPFIKAGVLRRLLAAMSKDVDLDIVTRWHPQEVAAGVSDLEIFDLISGRPRSKLRLLDNLHAKLYISDARLLAGSANLTATALGWCDDPNIELLMPVSIDDPNVQRCLDSLKHARDATMEERDAIRAAADAIDGSPLPLAAAVVDEMASVWLPRLAAPANLFHAYRPRSRERLTRDSLEAADHDLAALALPPGLSETAFIGEVGRRFCEMPAIVLILRAAEEDLTDEAAAALVATLSINAEISPATGWRIVRDWLTMFMGDRYEIAPQSFITRPKSGSPRR
ncbi:phospholipase D family protein [Rhizobium leguminosarum]|uniref:phospholipase D family protein n=1 Tax=Rhizobium leguminosarum TaxID=384 RepID=UPI00144232C0|nr:phospholipase D family protein [Rhizobium leguminosarum]MBY5841271.1 hypothetical protein [Rhizobium leguminosarum]NKM80970.1 hypothetical protein [Rhizobium leguminosarum bv. viciae]QSZ07255.1 phospholipase D family protein [Rhizobium leguminosarum]